MKQDKKALPPIPNKRYFNISEVADLCGVSQHVLRYWEQEFSELKPIKEEISGRRCYQMKDVLMIRRIRDLLYDKQFTIKGAKKQLRLDRSKTVKPVSKHIPFQEDFPQKVFQEVIVSLKSLLRNLKD